MSRVKKYNIWWRRFWWWVFSKSTTTITLSSNPGFTKGDDVEIGHEYLRVTKVKGDTITVKRPQPITYPKEEHLIC